MILIIESIIICILFTVMVYIMSRDPIKTLYNYPPKIQERVKTLKEYKDKIPTQENKIVAKIFASILFLIILCIILRYINGYTTFLESFGYGLLLWTISGAILITILFITISIPLADKRQSKKAGYDKYKRETRKLLPIPKF